MFFFCQEFQTKSSSCSLEFFSPFQNLLLCSEKLSGIELSIVCEQRLMYKRPITRLFFVFENMKVRLFPSEQGGR